ncbi:MAG: hypothetical protein WDM79_18505 [Terricaulis sp.]
MKRGALADRVAVNPPRAVRMAKRLAARIAAFAPFRRAGTSASFQALAHETPDHKEAVDAFFEKRKPRFTGG